MFSYWMSELLISLGIKFINIAHAFHCDGLKLDIDSLLNDCELCVDDWIKKTKRKKGK